MNGQGINEPRKRKEKKGVANLELERGRIKG